MLHYAGTIEALELGEAAKGFIFLYAKKGESACDVPFKDLVHNRVRYVQFQLLNDQWLFIDLVDGTKVKFL